MYMYGKAAAVNEQCISTSEKDILSKALELLNVPLHLLYFAKRRTTVLKMGSLTLKQFGDLV